MSRGAYINNQWGFQDYSLTLSGYNTFNDNSSIGLEAYSNGNILISNLIKIVGCSIMSLFAGR